MIATASRHGALGHVRWGIIGVGDVTERKSGPAFQQAERSSLVAVMRRDGERAADYARRHGVPRWYDNADELLADPEVDAVYVATPPDSHRELTLRALEAGKPVYVEKPIARTAVEAEEMVAASTSASRPLFVAYYRRALPRFARVRDLLDAGAVGAVRTVRVTHLAPEKATDALPWRLRPEISGGGLFVDLGSHTLDLLDHLLGELEEVEGGATAQGSVRGVEDTVSLAFRIGDIRGTGLWCFAAGEARDELEITGTTGSLRFSVFGTEPLVLERDGVVDHIEAGLPDPVQLPLVQAVVDELTGRGVCPSTGATALRTARIADRALDSFRREHAVK